LFLCLVHIKEAKGKGGGGWLEEKEQETQEG